MGRRTRERKAREQQWRGRGGALEGHAEGGRVGTLTLLVRWVVYPLLLALLGVLAYGNSFDAPFVLDDKRQIVREPAIRPPLSLDKILGTPRPVVTASLALNYAIGELDVRGYHVLNLVAHIACGIVLYGFTRHTFRLPVLRPRFGPWADHLALVVAALFLAHPLQTESVTYVIQRAEVFAAIAILAGLWTAAVAAWSANARRHLITLCVIGILGALSKPSVIALPILFVLYDWCFLAEGRAEEMRRRWPIYRVLLVLTVATAVWGWLYGAADPTERFRVSKDYAWRYFTWQFGVVLHYVRLILLPDRLCFDCGYLAPWPVLRSALGGAVVLPALILGTGLVAAGLARKRHPLLTFSVLGSALVLAPTSSVIPLPDVYVEHRLYLPIGLLAMGAVGVAFRAAEVVGRRGRIAAVAARSLMVATALTAGAALVSLTIARNEVYADMSRLWLDSVAKAPENDRLQYNLGNEHFRRGQFEQAVERYRESIRLRPTRHVAQWNLGLAYMRLGRHAEAIEVFEGLRTRQPTWARVNRQLAGAYLATGRTADAVLALERVVELEPGNVATRRGLAALYARVGRAADARREYLIASGQTPPKRPADRPSPGAQPGGQESRQDDALDDQQ